MTNSFKKFTPVRKYVMLMNFFKNIISFVRFKKKKKKPQRYQLQKKRV